LSVVVQAVPDSAFAASPGASDGEESSPDMLGLFDGKPLIKGQVTDDLPVRATIYLFQRNLERVANGREDLSEQIRITLWRELGSYLGFDEDYMQQVGLC
jgi:predicted Zn-dependent protease with MMP-like domain